MFLSLFWFEDCDLVAFAVPISHRRIYLNIPPSGFQSDKGAARFIARAAFASFG
jgi:hypothetical protein